MEKPKTRSWSYTGLRVRTEGIANNWRYHVRGVPLLEQGVDRMEVLAVRTINMVERLERLTYPSRWERIEDDSINPLE